MNNNMTHPLYNAGVAQMRQCKGTWVYCIGMCNKCLSNNISYSDHTEPVKGYTLGYTTETIKNPQGFPKYLFRRNNKDDI